MSKVLVKVTQNHIGYGRSCDAMYCPVALAIRDAIKETNVNVVSVSYLVAHVRGYSVYLPSEVQNFVEDFDHLRDVEPFEFELELANEEGR